MSTVADVEDHLFLDASVLVELVVAGLHRDDADRLLERIATNADLVLLSGAHGLIEAASAIRRLTLGGRLDADAGARAVRWLGELDVVLDPTTPRLRRLWNLRETMSAYDAAHAAGAEALGLPLVTTDEPLLRACRAAGIRAKHLRDA